MLIKINTVNLYILVSIWICQYIFVHSTNDADEFSEWSWRTKFSEFTSTDSDLPTKYYKEIENVTCITDKYGLGYIGIQNTTHDGETCVEWSRNVLLYTRYKLKGKNISENYCRNPDGDSSGPWCFVANRSSYKKYFKFKHCGIPLCKLISVPQKINMGVPMLLERKCPTGFEEKKIIEMFVNKTYCQVKQEYIFTLPKGEYFFKLLNVNNNTFCPENFTNEGNRIKNFFCIKSDSKNNTIEFPKYIKSPKQGELIFIALKFGPDVECPKMSSKSIFVIRKSERNSNLKEHFTICHYLYLTYSKNRDSIDRKLEIFISKPPCPDGWIIQSSLLFTFYLKALGPYKRKSFYMCRPRRNVYEYPDGDYCLFSRDVDTFRLYRCPEGFIDVNLNIFKERSVKFCCRQAQKPSKEVTSIYNYFNFTSMFIIHTVDKCESLKDDRNITVTRHTFESSIHNSDFQCMNCDLFNVFNMGNIKYSRVSYFSPILVKACKYEKPSNGFAYVSLNGRCPPNLNIGYIRYTKNRFSFPYSPKLSISFCSMVNYPKNISFPNGRYCIYKLGVECPKGFQEFRKELQLKYYKFSSSEGDISNNEMNLLCCKFESSEITFENATLPYITKNSEFGLPYLNESFKCIHGLKTHTGVEDNQMCHYYPTTEVPTKLSIIYYSPDDCEFSPNVFHGSFRILYSTGMIPDYCQFHVNNRPPPGNYCAPFSKSCPSPYFYYVTYHPLMQRVICCRKPTPKNVNATDSEFSAGEWTSDLNEFSLLAFRKKCPIFRRYNYGKEPIKRGDFYFANDIGITHKANLTSIGIEVNIDKKVITVNMFICDYILDPYNKSETWPHGQYAFPRPLSGCPSNFKSGTFTHSMETVNPSFAHSDTIHLDGDYMIGGSLIKWGFCVKQDNNKLNYYNENSLSLPNGRYCLLKVGITCASGFSEGFVKFLEIAALNTFLVKREGVLPKIDTDGPFITYHFCCQSARGDIAHKPIFLPTESGSFYLLKFGTYCQRVFGMKFTEEYICIDSEDTPQHLNYTFQAPYKVEGSTPVTGSFIRGCDFQINLCYYELETAQKKPAPKTVSLVSWPKGSYIYIKQLNQKCLEGFDEGTTTVQTFFKFHPRFMNILMFGSLDENIAIFSFCKRNSSINDSKSPENWPAGNYCFIFENRCPRGMIRHKLRSFDHFIFSRQGDVYIYDWSNLCCKKDGLQNSKNLTFFPGQYYTTIIQPSLNVHTCPSHGNTRVALIDLQNEIICYYERRDEGVEFPDGDYLLPPPQKPMNSCAPGFKIVHHKHISLNTDDKLPKTLTFCQKEKKNASGQIFPRGNYCILTKDYKCPSSQFTVENMLIIPKHHFADELYRFSRYLACCQQDDKIISNMKIPRIPLQLFSSFSCSYIDGIASVEQIEESTILVQKYEIERPPYNRREMKIKLCRYHLQGSWNFEIRCQCHPNAKCYLSYNDFNCHCKTGYFGDGKIKCAQITNETDNCANTCDKKLSVCSKVTSLNAYRCVCSEGYEEDGIICRPSCKTRNCNVFSKCVVDSIESHCACLKESVEADSGKCHGDLINTIYHLSGFDYLNKMNLSCFSKEAYDHLVLPLMNRMLFIIYPLSENNILFHCDKAGNYYGFYYGIKIPIDIHYSFDIVTESGRSLKISKNEKNKWTVGSIPVITKHMFTNAIVLYTNTSNYMEFQSSALSEVSRLSERTKIIFFVLGGISMLILIVMIIFLINRKRPMFTFNRVNETRSESNIHFITAEDQVQIDSN